MNAKTIKVTELTAEHKIVLFGSKFTTIIKLVKVPNGVLVYHSRGMIGLFNHEDALVKA